MTQHSMKSVSLRLNIKFNSATLCQVFTGIHIIFYETHP